MGAQTWGEAARERIQSVHETLPADISLSDRAKAIDAAYPFSDRVCWPYKAWLAERRKYLARYGYVKRGAPALPILDAIEAARKATP